MSITRRAFLGALGAAAYPCLTGQTFAAANPMLGLIFPPENSPIPADAKMLFPSGVDFIGNGVGLPGGMTVPGYEQAVPRILPRAAELARKGANVVSVFGSSITFYKGAKFHEELIAQVEKATGRRATTQSNGLLDGLRTANARRVAIATAYTDDVTERLKLFLQEYGFDVTAAKGLGLTKVSEGEATRDILVKLSTDSYAASKKADAVVISCGALKTIDVIVPVEDIVKVPVISSTPHGLWHGVKLLGVPARIKGFGMVMARGWPAPALEVALLDERVNGVVPVLCAVAAGSQVSAARPVPIRAAIDTDIAIVGACGPTCVALRTTGSGQAAHLGQISVDGPTDTDFAALPHRRERRRSPPPMD